MMTGGYSCSLAILICACVCSRKACVFVNLSTLHDKIHMLQRTHVRQGIAIHGNDVGILAGFDCAHIFGFGR